MMAEKRGTGNQPVGTGADGQGSVPSDFQLIETMAWRPGEGYALLGLHLARLAGSAAVLGFACEIAAVERRLASFAESLTGPRRVRLLLSRDGAVEVSHAALATLRLPLRVAWAQATVDSADPLLRHKTTRRALLESELSAARAACEADEVLFVNERGEVTEGSWTSLFLPRGAGLVTPALASGLLAGTLRRALLEDPAARTAEAVLRPVDVAAAPELLLGNAVRGLLPARLVG
jgi:branched-subunit amino acid aminotransferase/4-amino-4-deoxychorismate lyase